MNQLKFVKGGTLKTPGSNRMKETATELHRLDPLSDANQSDLAFLLSTYNDMESIVGFFDMLKERDIHIVGSNDIVYSSIKYSMLCQMIVDGKIPQGASLSFFTRKLGLRNQLIRIVSEM